MNESQLHEATLRRIGAAIRRQRKTRAWTQERLAEAASLSAYFVGAVERGQAALSMRSLAQIAHALEVPLATLFDWDRAPDRDGLARELRQLVQGATAEELRALVEVARVMAAGRRR